MEIFKRREFQVGESASVIVLESKCVLLCSRNTEEANVARAKEMGIVEGEELWGSGILQIM